VKKYTWIPSSLNKGDTCNVQTFYIPTHTKCLWARLMVVETRGAEPIKEDKNWIEQNAPWLIGGLVGAGAIGAGGYLAHQHFGNQMNPVNTPEFETPPEIMPYPKGPPLTSLNPTFE